jgi:hypothetical protein
MKMGSKILIGCIVVLTILSLSATFYKTVILQDFEMTGVWVEFPTEDSSYVWFVHDNEEYELELETSNYDEILLAVAGEVGAEPEELDADFVAYLASAYDEAEVTGTSEEESEEMSEESTEEEELLSDESASSSDASFEDAGTDSEALIEGADEEVASSSLEAIISI